MERTPAATGQGCKKRPREEPTPYENLKDVVAKWCRKLDPAATGQGCKKRPREGPTHHDVLKDTAAKRRKELDVATQQLRDAQRAWAGASLRSEDADSEVREYPRRLYFSSDPEKCPELPGDIIAAILEPVACGIYRAGVGRNETWQPPVGTLHLRRFLHPVTLDKCRLRMIEVSGQLKFLRPWLGHTYLPVLRQRPWKSAEYFGSLEEVAAAQFTRRFRLGRIQLLVFGQEGLLHFKVNPGVLKTRINVGFTHGKPFRWRKKEDSDGTSITVPYATPPISCEVGYGGRPKRLVWIAKGKA